MPHKLAYTKKPSKPNKTKLKTRTEKMLRPKIFEDHLS